jgi:hypothetical protein
MNRYKRKTEHYHSTNNYRSKYHQPSNYRYHSEHDELRMQAQAMINDPEIIRLNQYKTSPCCWWSQTGFCPWGTTCVYLHQPIDIPRRPVCIHYKITGSCREMEHCKFDHENLDWPESIPCPVEGKPLSTPFLIEPVRSPSPLSFLDEDYDYSKVDDADLQSKKLQMDKLISYFRAKASKNNNVSA